MSFSAKDFPHTITKDSVSVYFNKKMHLISKDHPSYEDLLMALCQKNWNSIPPLLTDLKGAITRLSKGELKVDEKTGEIWFGTKEGDKRFPEDLEKSVFSFMKERLPFQPLIEFGKKLLNNPSESSIHQFYTYISKNSFPLTESGNFLAYKKVAPDYKDLYSQSSHGKAIGAKSFDNTPGKIVKMPREEVVNDPHTHCAAGLHAANWDYAHNQYGIEDAKNVVVAVEVNPEHVVSVPVDGCQKLRVCEYKVLEVVDDEVKTPMAPTDLGKDQQDVDHDLDRVQKTIETRWKEPLDGAKFFFFESVTSSVSTWYCFLLKKYDPMHSAHWDGVAWSTVKMLRSDEDLKRYDISYDKLFQGLRAIKNKKGGWPHLIEMRRAYRAGKLRYSGMTKKEVREFTSLMDLEDGR